jgi:hypothetical protein
MKYLILLKFGFYFWQNQDLNKTKQWPVPVTGNAGAKNRMAGVPYGVRPARPQYLRQKYI